MNYHELPPAPSLRHLVRCYWFLTGQADDGQPGDPALPDGSPELIINLADPFLAVGTGVAPVAQPGTMLVGQITGPFVVRPTGRIDLVAIRLEAHAGYLFTDDLAAITDRWIGPSELDPDLVGPLPDRLRAANGPEARAAVLDGHLAGMLPRARIPDPKVALAVRAIRDAHGAITLNRLTRDLGTTTRTLQRLFARQVGLSPKLLARIVRFHRVFSAWRTDPRSLAQVAAECGYFDQSHLVHDFRAFAGAAPAAFLASQPEFTAFFTSGGYSASGGTAEP